MSGGIHEHPYKWEFLEIEESRKGNLHLVKVRHECAGSADCKWVMTTTLSYEGRDGTEVRIVSVVIHPEYEALETETQNELA